MTEKHLAENQPCPPWYVYIIRCRDNSYYTGITTDLLRRIGEHNLSKEGARYTRTRRPVVLVYSERAASRSTATRRENQIKKLSVSAKKLLINTRQGGSIKNPVYQG